MNTYRNVESKEGRLCVFTGGFCVGVLTCIYYSTVLGGRLHVNSWKVCTVSQAIMECIIYGKKTQQFKAGRETLVGHGILKVTCRENIELSASHVTI